MRHIEDTRLPADIDAQPPVQAAAALRSVIRGYHEEIEREQRLPKALVEQFHAAGFYSLVIPRELGGLQADPLTYLRVVELLGRGRRLGRLEPGQQQHRPARHARSAGRGRPRDLRARGRHRHRRHRRAGGRAGGAGRWWLPGHRSVALRQRLPGKRLDAGQLPDPRRRSGAPEPGRHLGLLAGGLPALGSAHRRGQLGRDRAARDRELRLDGRGRLPAGAADDGPRRRPARQPVEALAGDHATPCRPRPGSGPTTAR